jgi:hypothetical protein
VDYVVEIGSSAMIYIQSFLKIGSAIQMLVGGVTQTHRQDGDRISLLIFFHYKGTYKSPSVGVCSFRHNVSVLRCEGVDFPLLPVATAEPHSPG